MGSMRGHKYNGAIDRIQAKPDKAYIIGDGKGVIFTHNVFDGIPKVFHEADYVITDIPYNKSALKSYYTKADKELDKDFTEFLDRIFEVVTTLGVDAFYVETGKQSLKAVQTRMAKIFPSVRTFEAVYYNKYPCYFVFGEREKSAIPYSGTVQDELLVIDEIIAKRKGAVLDFCNGQGSVSRYACNRGRRFICSDLNINRSAVAIEELSAMGNTIREVEEEKVK